MNRLPLLLGAICFLAAAVLSVVTAGILAVGIERRTIEAVREGMRSESMDWVEISADGLRVYLSGTAPSEAASFRAASRASGIVDADRVINEMSVARQDATEPPRFSVDMLRNTDGIQLIGLVPTSTGSNAVVDALGPITDGVEVSNLVESADFPAPANWDAALDYGLRALQELPRSKVTVYSDRVEVQAISESVEQRAEFIASLQEDQPTGVEIVFDISAPRPVITPFTLRFVIDEDGARFETCAADTVAARDQIVAAAEAAGAGQPLACQIGLGVPSPQWADAVETALETLAEHGAGTVAFSDADVTFIAAQGTPQDAFDSLIGELDAALPDLFSLEGILPEPPEDTTQTAGPARFIATLNDSGAVRLRGRVPEGSIGRSLDAFARALFGIENTDIATREVADLPEGWTVRAMAGLEALSTLNDGTLTLEPEQLIVAGNTGNPEAVSDLTRLLSEQLGQAAAFELDVTYVEALDPVASLPTPEQCVERIQAVQDDGKITFEPGSLDITEASGAILDEIAEILPDCRHVRMEIGGHTDSQGREEMNLNLSQSRADAVLNALLARNVLVSNLTAQGYGESQPIASNETEDGRERNRRIEFSLLSTAVGAVAGDEDEDAAETDDGSPAAEGEEGAEPEIRPTPRPESVVEAAANAAEDDEE